MRNLLKIMSVLTLLVAFPAAAPAAGNEETFRQLELFGDIFERVRSFYVDEMQSKRAFRSSLIGSIRRMIGGTVRS